MKKLCIPLLAMLMVVACEKESLPSKAKEQISTFSSSIPVDLRGDKVDVCHNGHIINVSINALQTHLAHGDLVVLDGDGHLGVWKGTGMDTNGNVYEMEVSLACGSGTVVYDKYCTGTLTFESQKGNSYTYSEVVSEGCIQNCTVVIKVLSDGKIDFFEDCGEASLSAILSPI